MKASLFLLPLLVAILMVTAVTAAKGGCLGCTVAASVITEIAQANNVKIDKAISLWCTALAGDQTWLLNICNQALVPMGTQLQSDLDAGRVPDQSCAALGLCEGDDLKCSLWPKKQLNDENQSAPQPSSPQLNQFFAESESIFKFVTDSLVGWSELGQTKPSLEDYDHIVKHKPMEEQKLGEPKWFLRPWVDGDKDGFSTFERLRGTSWRGRDCDDNDPTVYPGRKRDTKNNGSDYNCNGISGINPQTKRSYKSEFCDSTKQFNFVALGDSATAHFSLPPCWLSGQCAGRPGAYAELFNVISNEVDFPQCGLVTGFLPEQCPSLYKSLTDFQSVYNHARNMNPCVHRSYQNIGVNGAKSTSMAPGTNNDGVINSYTPDPDNDHPSAVFLSLIGNDVCSKNPTTESMTDPHRYREAILDSLNYLDRVLAPGSHVWLGGLVKGSALFDAMGNEHHPISSSIKYSAFYDFLNCHNTSPCAPWLNTNAANRRAADQHAIKLNDVAQDIVKHSQFKNFSLHYNDVWNIIEDVFKDVVSKGFSPTNLVEATDGFHPSSTLNSLYAKKLIQQISQSSAAGAEIFTPNPYAKQILQKFGPNLNGY